MYNTLVTINVWYVLNVHGIQYKIWMQMHAIATAFVAVALQQTTNRLSRQKIQTYSSNHEYTFMYNDYRAAFWETFTVHLLMV